MDGQTFLRRLRDGNGLLGSWCTFASFASTELMATLDFDFLVLDMQHTEITQAQFPAWFGAFPENGPAAVVRAARNDYHLINWLFDMGAPAVLVPMVNSPEEARLAVAAAKFPPLGRRSFGPYRAARYGARVAEYVAEADSSAVLIVQVEDAAAAREIEAILDVPGIDALFMGPNDLAFSMLEPGQSIQPRAGEWAAFARTPEAMELCARVLAACRARKVPFGMTAGAIAEAREWIARGASFVTFGSDFTFLRAGAQMLCGG
jgi:4-hydroxy-2-oxoheptanedioate aldolase